MEIRIHNNSWGNKWNNRAGQLGYEAGATSIDNFITDPKGDHPDFVILVAGGNDAQKDSRGKSQIGTVAAAKNCITVGATGTTRPNDGQRFDPTVPPLSNKTETAIFSSRGPTLATKDSAGNPVLGRIKPDVAAPGVAILSAASGALPATDRVRFMNGPSDSNDWIYLSGTSMSTPLVSGCVALLREALQGHGKQFPSAALVKALLVNGAVCYSSPTGPGFDYEQGFGLVNMQRSINMVKNSTFIEGGSKFETTKYDVPAVTTSPAERKVWRSGAISNPQGRYRLSVSLAYADLPGALLQNDVNLIVQANGVERHGNMGSGDGFDTTNNVEKIIWNEVPGETFEIIVRANAFTKPTYEQPLAVAWGIQVIDDGAA